MKRRKKHQKKSEAVNPWTPVDENKESASEQEVPIKVSGWSDDKKPVRRKFPGPQNSGAALRVAMEKQAYADIVSHAKESLDREICGVLVGDVCEDEEGLFIQVKDIIRGSAADEASTHVTFTHETWNHIHETMKKEHPKLRMLGWYHSHPGFGVVFSEMDLFIQENFFSGPTQIALVTDPLGGDTAIIANTGKGTEYLDRFWVDGREFQLKQVTTGEATESGEVPAKLKESLEAVENRLNHVLQAMDEQNRAIGRTLMMLAVLVCLTLAFLLGNSIYNSIKYQRSPPEKHDYLQVPIKVGDKTVYLGVDVVKWEVPPDLYALHQEMTEEQIRKFQEEIIRQLQGPPPEQPKKEGGIKGWFKSFGKGKE